MSGTTANVMSIPRETASENTTERLIQIVENLIGDHLDEIQADIGYANYANTKIFTKLY